LDSILGGCLFRGIFNPSRIIIRMKLCKTNISRLGLLVVLVSSFVLVGCSDKIKKIEEERDTAVKGKYTWIVIASILGASAVVLFVVGAGLGSSARRNSQRKD
jgi:hypothetical protein